MNQITDPSQKTVGFNLDHVQMLGKEGTNAAILVPIVGVMIDMYKNKSISVKTLRDLLILTILIISARQTIEKAGSLIDSIRIDRFYYLRYIFSRMRYGAKQFNFVVETENKNNSSSVTKKYYYLPDLDAKDAKDAKDKSDKGVVKQKINDQLLSNALNQFGSVNLYNDFGTFYCQIAYNIVACINNRADFISIYVPNHHMYLDAFLKFRNTLIVNSSLKGADYFAMMLSGKVPKFIPKQALPENKVQFIHQNKTYTKLMNDINISVNIQEATNDKRSAGIFWINSPPGLGKTYFLEFYSTQLGQNCNFTSIINIMAESMPNHSLKDIIQTVDSHSWPGKGQLDNDGKPIRLSLLIAIDEFDKWMRKYEQKFIDSKKEENRKPLNVASETRKDKNGQDQNVQMTTVLQEKLTDEEIQEARILARTEVCTTLKQLFDGNYLTDTNFYRFTIIILSNGNEDLFNGVEEGLLSSTKDRIQYQTISCLKSNDIEEFLVANINHINEYSNGKVKIDITDAHISEIKSMNLSLSYRALSRLVASCGNSIDTLISYLKDPAKLKEPVDLSQ